MKRVLPAQGSQSIAPHPASGGLLLVGLLAQLAWSSTCHAGGDGAWTMFSFHPSAPQPGFRWDHIGAWDPVGRRLVVFGGATTGTDLWVLDLSGEPAWRQATIPGPPSLHLGPVGVYDSRRNRLIAHGGGVPMQVWVLSLADADLAWSRIIPTVENPREWFYHAGIYDPIRDRLVVFGGVERVCGREGCDVTYLREVWALDLSEGPVWSHIATQGEPPPALNQATAVYDPVRDRMLLYGGSRWENPQTPMGRAWALTLSGTPTWSVLAEPVAPSLVRDSHSAIYDPLRDRMVIHGGVSNGIAVRDTWVLELSEAPAWRELHPADPPSMRRMNHLAVYDPTHDRMIVNSGYETPTTWALTWGDLPTTVLISAERPVAMPSRILLGWRVANDAAQATVHRREASNEWSPRAIVRRSGGRPFRYEDLEVQPGGRYGYRLELDDGVGATGGEVWVDVPNQETLTLAPVEQPLTGPVRLILEAPGRDPALLELFDVHGRRIAHRTIEDFGAGRPR